MNNVISYEGSEFSKASFRKCLCGKYPDIMFHGNNVTYRCPVSCKYKGCRVIATSNTEIGARKFWNHEIKKRIKEARDERVRIREEREYEQTLHKCVSQNPAHVKKRLNTYRDSD